MEDRAHGRHTPALRTTTLVTADALLQVLTQAVFVAIFGVVGYQAVRQPSRVRTDTALLFGAIAIVVAQQWLVAALSLPVPPLVSALSATIVMSFPYLLLRLVDDFAGVPARVQHLAAAGLVLSAISLFASPTPRPVPLTLFYVLYFLAVQIYAAAAIVKASRRSVGVTRRRLQTVAGGSVLLGLVLLVAGARALAPDASDLWGILSRVFGLASGMAYYLGFATPTFLRRAWQEPELRAFLARAARLPRLPSTQAIVAELCSGTASALGVPSATIGLWDVDRGVLRFGEGATAVEVGSGDMVAGRAFADQRPTFAANAVEADPQHAALYRQYGSVAVMAAPITAGELRLGVLVVYAARAPLFAEDDLALLQLMADQAAVILESRRLIDEAARVHAQEEATRLKDDFLSSAAHDLKTPLTTIIAQSQLLERRARIRPTEPPDLASLQRLTAEATRLRTLVLTILDSARAEYGQWIGNRETLDLADLARSACLRFGSAIHPCRVEADQPVVGTFDRARMDQVLENLLGNAVKYSPDGGEIVVRVWREGDEANMTVTDRGIGVPSTDLPHLFERFHRGANVDDRRFAGMGLGLFIVRGIVEGHGGRIRASSRVGSGTTFHVTLPIGTPTAAGTSHA